MRPEPMTDADTCRRFVVPLLQTAGWDTDPHSIAEQRYFTAGRIVSQGPTARRRPGKRADYLLRYKKYAIDGELQFTLSDVLKVAPIWRHGNVAEIVRKFGVPTNSATL
jgi:hypothetical protein